MDIMHIITFHHNSSSSDFIEIENEIYDIIQKKKKQICSLEEVSVIDMHWGIRIDLDMSTKSAKVTLCNCHLSDLREMEMTELLDELSSAKENLEDLEEEYEEIEDLDEDEYEDYDFESNEEYQERLEEIEIDILSTTTTIEAIEKVIDERKM